LPVWLPSGTKEMGTSVSLVPIGGEERDGRLTIDFDPL
jgi:hypothetical protein